MFEPDTPVFVRFPLTREQQDGDRGAWPWLSGVILEQVGADEYRVCVVDDRVAELEDGTGPPPARPTTSCTGPAVTEIRVSCG